MTIITMPKIPAFIDTRKLRQELHLSQPQFATQFGLCLSTLRQWEQGRRSPDGPTRVLLTLIQRAPDMVREALQALPPA